MWPSARASLAACARRLAADRAGAAAVVMGILSLVLFGLSAAAIDFGIVISARDEMQRAADAGAIAGAKELSLSDSKRENTPAVVEAVVAGIVDTTASKGEAQLSTRVLDDPLRVEVTLTRTPALFFSRLLGERLGAITVTSAAQVIGKPNICMLGLDPSANGTIALDHKANVSGRNCAVFSNSRHTNSIKSKKSAFLSASFICTAGGKDGGPGNFAPEPITDCPTFEDPLALRPEPQVGPCTQVDRVVDGVTTTLDPGTYCGGLRLTGGADVRLRPGIYVIRDGPLLIERGSRLTGVGVGFFLRGAGAVLDLRDETTVAVEAATSGPLAGLLFFESRAQPIGGRHRLLSENAQVMVGTIYLPRGKLAVGGTSRVGGESAYTAIIARTIEIADGPRIVLNTDYDLTDVPVPEGIKGAGQPVALIK